jgi:RNA polymerase sigma-70 factor, ECF subfamily
MQLCQVARTGEQERLALEEAGLLALVAAGDVGAPLAELYRRYAGRLYGFGLRLLGDSHLAEEMVQECFVRLWRTAGRFDPTRASVGTYLFVIARSVAVDVRRRPGNRPLVVLPEGAEPADHDDLEERITQRLSIRAALASLSPAHREVIMLAHDDGLTQSEIADRLGIPLGTVKTRMFHGLRALRVALAERGFDV